MITPNGPECRAAQELLPWRDGGTLSSLEAEALEVHLGVCSECRRELERWRQLSGVLRAESQRVPVLHPGAVAALLDRLDEPTLEPSVSLQAKQVRRWWARVAAAAVLVAAGTGVWMSRGAIGPPAFHTLSEPQEPATASLERLRLVLEPTATQQEMAELLAMAGARVVDGPSPYGVWTLEATDPAVAVEVLRASSLVRFAEVQEGAR